MGYIIKPAPAVAASGLVAGVKQVAGWSVRAAAAVSIELRDGSATGAVGAYIQLTAAGAQTTALGDMCVNFPGGCWAQFVSGAGDLVVWEV